METIVHRKQLQESLFDYRENGKSIGFVPTMGALHQGHLSLIEKAKSENDIVVASIFVNPTQFNNPNDLLHYPRTLEADKKLLESVNCDLLFLPSVNEMYPDGFTEKTKEINLGGLDLVMEGAHRPGHFEGVIQVVNKLFESVGKCKSYFGQKDFQQLAIVRRMVREWKLPVEVIGCPIIREVDGLAMSSRNVRLTNEQRKAAPLIHQLLVETKQSWRAMLVSEQKKQVAAKLLSHPILKLEYFEIVDRDSLQDLRSGELKNAVACIAVKLGDIRLIDNMLLD